MFVVLVCRWNLASSHLDEFSKCVVDGVVVSEYFGHIGVDLGNVRTSAEALGVLAPDAALHLGEIILPTKVVYCCVILLHSLYVRVVLPVVH